MPTLIQVFIKKPLHLFHLYYFKGAFNESLGV